MNTEETYAAAIQNGVGVGQLTTLTIENGTPQEYVKQATSGPGFTYFRAVDAKTRPVTYVQIRSLPETVDEDDLTVIEPAR
ncbi:hypothetical protein [Herbiconiux sp.]|uniref:hypothetical protein n=1 Tax=Herbiconiux sp. TaxID=1871186 RepID=UPI0025BF770B|nr:hypothetical protein [Herbiconiux sp.]